MKPEEEGDKVEKVIKDDTSNAVKEDAIEAVTEDVIDVIKEDFMDVVKEEAPEISHEEAMLDDEMDEDVEESDIEIDEEHYSINHVEVNIEDHGSPPLCEADFCPIVDDSICIVDENQEEAGEGQEDDEDEEEEEDAAMVEDHPATVVGEVGKAPVYLECEVCGVTLTSILNFTNHMKKLHKDSEQERNKPFSCDFCGQGFYFLSSRNSHQSKAHRQTTGATFRYTHCGPSPLVSSLPCGSFFSPLYSSPTS